MNKPTPPNALPVDVRRAPALRLKTGVKAGGRSVFGMPDWTMGPRIPM
ncbi:MAG: hypothetical protein U0324_38675 [Polyangiales bacterium]